MKWSHCHFLRKLAASSPSLSVKSPLAEVPEGSHDDVRTLGIRQRDIIEHGTARQAQGSIYHYGEEPHEVTAT